MRVPLYLGGMYLSYNRSPISVTTLLQRGKSCDLYQYSGVLARDSNGARAQLSVIYQNPIAW